MTPVDVSVIIPTYNRAGVLPSALDSVLAQNFPGNVEIIVIDDCSTDDTVAIVSSRYPSVRLLRMDRNGGNSPTRNRALGIARGKYIAFLDSDDFWRPDYLRTQIAALEQNPGSIVLCGVELRFSPGNRTVILAQKPDLSRYLSPAHQLLIPFRHFIPSGLSAMVFPREVFARVGLFEENFRVGSDIDLCLRSLAQGYPLVFTELPLLVKHEGAADQLTSPKNLRLREHCVFQRIDRFYAIQGAPDRPSSERLVVPSRRRVYGESLLSYARAYFKNRQPLNGLRCALGAACRGFPLKALHTAGWGLRRMITRTPAPQT